MIDQVCDISVVIPTHNRYARLLTTLEALGRQTLPTRRFEVIVALDAVTDGSDAIKLRSWPFELHCVVPGARGAGAARNAGAARARGDRLVFFDDDITVDEGFLEAHLDACRDDPDSVIVGHLPPDVVRRGWFEDNLLTWWKQLFHALRDADHRFSYTDVLSGNFSISRKLFEHFGGFDTNFMVREDYEFGYRLIRHRVNLRFCAKARGLHHDDSDHRRNLKRAEAEGAADVRFARKHRELFWYLRFANLGVTSRSAALRRFVVFRGRPVGDFLQELTISAMVPLEYLRLRRLWRKLSYAVRAYSYYRGAALELGSSQQLWTLVRDCDCARIPSLSIDLDVTEGPVEIRRRVMSERPDAFRVFCGDQWVGEARTVPGQERPTIRHLDALLRQSAGSWAHVPIVAEMLPPLPGPSDRTSAPALAAVEPDGFRQITLGELDVADWSITPVLEALVLPARLLVRRNRKPLGWLTVDGPLRFGNPWAAIRAAILADTALCHALLRERILPEAQPTAPPVAITVIICTRDRTENLRRCLGAIRALDYPTYEVLVIDNAPQTDATEKLARATPGVRYVREDRPGLNWARNRGIAESTSDLIAFVDDDTKVDRHWLTALFEAFVDPDVMAVTGLVTPMALDTEARVYFEDVYGGMGKGFTPRWTRRASIGKAELLWASRCGVGANMAFRRETFARIGTFDPALDIGTKARGGGDIEIFHRVIAAGHTLLYEPSAVVWHEHRREFPALARQLADNGCGFAAYLTACARNRTVSRSEILRFILRAWIWGWLLKRLIRPGRHRRSLVLAEIRGAVKGLCSIFR